jgi:D-inositol-3-phosphate glycosyltransferase
VFLNIDMIAGPRDGGQNVHLGALAVALAQRGHSVTVHTRRDDVGLPDSVPYAPGVTVEHVRAGPARLVARDQLLPHVREFAGHLSRRWAVRAPDVVHAHSWTSGLATLDGARGLGIPVVQTFHALGEVERRHRQDAGPPERIRLEAQVGREAAAVIAMSTAQVAELEAYGIPSGAIRTVPYGVDVGRFRPDGPVARRGNRPRLLTIGRLVPQKGIDTVIEALCHLRDVELVVAGGPDRTELERDPEAVRLRRLALARGVAGRVLFMGRVPHEEVPALIRSADVVVSASWYEPFGMVPVEAMACGVAVVVSAVGGHLDTVVDGVTGLYVPPRVPSALAGRLRRLLTDPRLGASRRVAAEIEAVYSHVIDGRREEVVMAEEARPL